MLINILIVEDDIIQCELYQSFLKVIAHDLQCTRCLTIREAMEKYMHTRYPVIITDMDLPDGNGREFCRWVRALPYGKHSKIVMISGSNSQADIQDSYQAGIDAYLSKPVNVDVFLKTIQMLLLN
jgi:CheY-like chemotaxis protein